MAQLIIDYPDNQAIRIRDALCSRFNYSAESGLTKAQFIKKIVADWIKQQVKLEDIKLAQLAAATTIVDPDVT